MTDKILDTVKGVLGIGSETDFDEELMAHINTGFVILNSVCNWSSVPFVMTTVDDTWDIVTPVPIEVVSMIPTYISLYVKTIFDPSPSATVSSAYQTLLNRYEFIMDAYSIEEVA